MRPVLSCLVACAALLAGCGGAGDIGTVTGEAFYRERVALPSGTRLEVTLTDASVPDPQTGLVRRIIVAKAGQPPYSFEIPYRRADIDPDHRYVVSARLVDLDDVLFESSEPVPVITRGHPDEVELLLRRPATGSLGEHGHIDARSLIGPAG